jgi:ABC-type dipeptide/oligopeptide/nickel transport system permease component
MLTFIVRRLLWTVLVMFVITVVVFIIFFKTPGIDPARHSPSRAGARTRRRWPRSGRNSGSAGLSRSSTGS